MSESLIVRGRWVLADAETALADGAVLVEGDRIAALGDWSELRGRHPEAEVIGSETAAVIPGFVFSWDRANIRLGVGYSSFFVEGFFLVVPGAVLSNIAPEFDVFVRF